jgi:hypothetical protein
MSLHITRRSNTLRRNNIVNLHAPNVGVPKFVKHTFLYIKTQNTILLYHQQIVYPEKNQQRNSRME